MRFEKFTTKLQEALAAAQSAALGNDNQYIEPQHLLAALVNDPGISGLVAKAGGNANALKKALADSIARLSNESDWRPERGGADLAARGARPVERFPFPDRRTSSREMPRPAPTPAPARPSHRLKRSVRSGRSSEFAQGAKTHGQINCGARPRRKATRSIQN